MISAMTAERMIFARFVSTCKMRHYANFLASLIQALFFARDEEF